MWPLSLLKDTSVAQSGPYKVALIKQTECIVFCVFVQLIMFTCHLSLVHSTDHTVMKCSSKLPIHEGNTLRNLPSPTSVDHVQLTFVHMTDFTFMKCSTKLSFHVGNTQNKPSQHLFN